MAFNLRNNTQDKKDKGLQPNLGDPNPGTSIHEMPGTSHHHAISTSGGTWNQPYMSPPKGQPIPADPSHFSAPTHFPTMVPVKGMDQLAAMLGVESSSGVAVTGLWLQDEDSQRLYDFMAFMQAHTRVLMERTQIELKLDLHPMEADDE